MTHLQLRWEKEDDYNWLCHYELVLSLGALDIRREDDEGNKVRDSLTIALKEPTRRMTTTVPCWDRHNGQMFYDRPYRDGAHALWDSEALGGLPIKVVSPDGIMIEKQD